MSEPHPPAYQAYLDQQAALRERARRVYERRSFKDTPEPCAKLASVLAWWQGVNEHMASRGWDVFPPPICTLSSAELAKAKADSLARWTKEARHD